MVYEKDAKFELMWSPHQYPPLNPEDKGVWRPVQDQAGDTVGFVWSNRDDRSGVAWVTQTPEVSALYKYFSISSLGDFPAYPAYVNAESVPGVTLGEEKSGFLSGVRDGLQAIMDDIDESSS